MYYVYVLVSKKDGELYIGSTNNLKHRVKQHNVGNVPSTQARRPLTLAYYEAYADEAEARNRESNLKLRGQARYHLTKRIKNSITSQTT